MSQVLKNVLVVNSAITDKDFLLFSYYNELIRKKRYLGLCAFAALLILFGWCNLITGSLFLFWLFVVTGLVVPGIYLIQFHRSIKAQIRTLKLSDTPQGAYTVGVNSKGIYIDRSDQHLSLNWDDLDSVHRYGDCTYLYYTPARAVILPDRCVIDADTGDNAPPDTLWSFLQEHMPQKTKKKWRK